MKTLTIIILIIVLCSAQESDNTFDIEKFKQNFKIYEIYSTQHQQLNFKQFQSIFFPELNESINQPINQAVNQNSNHLGEGVSGQNLQLKFDIEQFLKTFPERSSTLQEDKLFDENDSQRLSLKKFVENIMQRASSNIDAINGQEANYANLQQKFDFERFKTIFTRIQAEKASGTEYSALLPQLQQASPTENDTPINGAVSIIDSTSINQVNILKF